MDKLQRVAIVGAGAAGLAAARSLQKAGIGVTIFDKARRPGGRMAVRRSDWGNLHHGAPLLSLPARALTAEARELLALAGDDLSPAVATNLGGGSSSAFSHVHGLNALAACWSAGLDIRCQHTATFLEQDDRGWWLQFAESPDDFGPYDQVILTAPTAQALSLLKGVPGQQALTAQLAATSHVPCWTLAWVPAEPPACHGLINTPDPATGMALIVRESARDGDRGSPRYVVHATPEWSSAHLEHSADAIADRLVAMAAAWLSCPADSRHAMAHRWRYATVSRAAGRPCLPGCNGLWYAGDACLGNTVADAMESGISAAKAVMSARSSFKAAA